MNDYSPRKFGRGIACGILLCLTITLILLNPLAYRDVGTAVEHLGVFAGLRIVFALGVATIWLRNRAKDFVMSDNWFILVLVALNLGALT